MKITGTHEDPKVTELIEVMSPLLAALDDTSDNIHIFGLKLTGRPPVRLLVQRGMPYTERLKGMAGWLKGVNIEVEESSDDGVCLGLRRDIRDDKVTCMGIIAYFACGVGHEVIPPNQDALSRLINKVRRLS
jgi:hypothetical protein